MFLDKLPVLEYQSYFQVNNEQDLKLKIHCSEWIWIFWNAWTSKCQTHPTSEDRRLAEYNEMHSQNLFDLSVGYMNSHLLTSDAVSPAFRHLNGLPRKETKQSATVQHRVRVSLTRRIISITRPHCRFCRPRFFVALSELNHPLFLPLSFFWGVARSLLAASKVTPKRAAAAAAAARFKPYGHVQKGGQTDMLGQHWGAKYVMRFYLGVDIFG